MSTHLLRIHHRPQGRGKEKEYIVQLLGPVYSRLEELEEMRDYLTRFIERERRTAIVPVTLDEAMECIDIISTRHKSTVDEEDYAYDRLFSLFRFQGEGLNFAEKAVRTLDGHRLLRYAGDDRWESERELVAAVRLMFKNQKGGEQ